MLETNTAEHGKFTATERQYPNKEKLAKVLMMYYEGTDEVYQQPLTTLTIMVASLLRPVECSVCGDVGLEGDRHYPAGDPENGPAHYRRA